VCILLTLSPIIDAADEVSAMVLVSLSAEVSAWGAAVSEVPAGPEFLHRPTRLVAENSVGRAVLAPDQNNPTYHRTCRAAD
jgi:hypothetical protein